MSVESAFIVSVIFSVPSSQTHVVKHGSPDGVVTSWGEPSRGRGGLTVLRIMPISVSQKALSLIANSNSPPLLISSKTLRTGSGTPRSVRNADMLPSSPTTFHLPVNASIVALQINVKNLL